MQHEHVKYVPDVPQGNSHPDISVINEKSLEHYTLPKPSQSHSHTHKYCGRSSRSKLLFDVLRARTEAAIVDVHRLYRKGGVRRKSISSNRMRTDQWNRSNHVHQTNNHNATMLHNRHRPFMSVGGVA